jgi:hypothetical protein
MTTNNSTFKFQWRYGLAAGLIILVLAVVVWAVRSSVPRIFSFENTSEPTLELPASIKPSATVWNNFATSQGAEDVEEFVRIKNVQLGAYIYGLGQKALLGTPDQVDPSAQWSLEDYQGSTRIRNRATGDYLAIEHQKDFVEVIAVEPVWMSPRWTLISDTSTGTTIIRNVWHNWEELFSEGDSLRHGRPPANPKAALWLIEPINGGKIAQSTSTPIVLVPTAAQFAESRGATIPWVEYEAEAGVIQGKVIGPDRTFGTLASEASGRRAVQLNAVGDFIQITSKKPANSIVVRYSIPDSSDGVGQVATLSLYINGKYQSKLALTSRFAWAYGGEAATFNIPVMGGAHHFYDESRALLKDISAGTTIRLQKNADDRAEFYAVDLLDLEQVAAPKAKPENFLSITEDCGAIPDDGMDDGAAVQSCIDRARSKKSGVWIPPGVFESAQSGWTVQEVSIQGAGMWYSTLHGAFARFQCTGNGCRFSDFSILGETISRDDQSSENGFYGSAGFGSRLENIWVEHTKVGFWVGPGTTNGLIVINSRFRDLFADGVNFNGLTKNSVVENSHFRNTGDDALASWSNSTSEDANANNVFRFNTVQIPWRANCFAIYGGQDNVIEDNVCSDTVTYPGLLIAQSFSSHPFSGNTVVQRNTILRGGGPMFHLDHGAIKIWAEQGPIRGLLLRDLRIESATFAGIELAGGYPISGLTIDHLEILAPGTYGIFIQSTVAGDAVLSNVDVENPGKGGILNYAPKLLFALTRGIGNRGWELAPGS